jgi:serine protease Do
MKTGKNIITKKSVAILIIMIISISLFSLTVLSGCIMIKPDAVTEQMEKIGEKIEEVTDAPKEFFKSENGYLSAFNAEVSSLVENVNPSVVAITVTAMREDFFGNEALAQGVGSGVIYTEDGYIITNNHVAGGAVELLVTLSDGANYKASVIGASPETDIAVIKIDAEDLNPASFASIEKQKVGDFVIAIGSPFGIQQTVTTGIISGKNRTIPVASDQLPIVDLIQTDAAINPGNSGGPLINIYGEVIGINTLIFSPSGTSAGIGFAIPTDTATNIADQIIKYGEARIPFIGIQMGVNETEIPGVYIQEIIADTPADKTGLKKGDIMVEFGGVEIKTPFDLLTQIIRQNCGDIVDIKIYRNGTYLDFNLQLEQCPAEITR